MLKISPLADTAQEALELAIERAPYLKRLAEQRIECVEIIHSDGVEAAFETAMDLMRKTGASGSIDVAMPMLRRAKREAHLAIAAADLSGAWSLAQVTSAMTRLADMAVNSALQVALEKRGLEPEGLFVTALGKMGAGELNYSSDIDLAAFYDPELFESGTRAPGDAASRVLQDVVRMLESRTPEGYVFRTDLRLRPDPRSTPLAVSTQMAEVYYESVGQNWERMVWIKARACAGDLAAATRFHKIMQPFVWRKHLDYWAIDDIHSIKRMINASKGDLSLMDPAADVKLGPGGIREIEFFVQTQQLILGGRNDALRDRETLAALDALTEAGIVEAPVAGDLRAAYVALRNVEHRIQMIADEQTHTLPSDAEKRGSVAQLCGYVSLEEFDMDLLAVRRNVHGHYRDLFAGSDATDLSGGLAGNLVFTGVDDDPGTLETLSGLGFQEPSRVIETIREWHRGNTPATRTRRGQQLLTALLPALLNAMAETGEPDTAFARFADFFSRLKSGVQTLSMLQAEPDLLADLVATLALAPRLSATLGQRPDLLEALIGGSALHALTGHSDMPFDEAMDMARRYHREQSFLIGHRLLHGRLDAGAAGAAYAQLADDCLTRMADAALHEASRKFGPVPGHWCVAALGKLGGEEMTATSDLDLLVIYESGEEGGGEGWFSRFAQRLITALSVQTAEGGLYEVDMRLRPAGRAGPVAVRLAAFERYQRDEAWTWEHMALTRLRPVAGNKALMEKLVSASDAVLSEPPEPEKLRSDILDMRQRLARDRPGSGLWDVKLAPGGLLDLEFIVQYLLLLRGSENAREPQIQAAIESLAKSGHVSTDAHETLTNAHAFLQSIQQIMRLAVGDNFDPETASAGLKACLARATGSVDFDAVQAQLEALKSEIAEIRRNKIGPLATES